MYYLREEIRPGGSQRFHGFRNWQEAQAALDQSVGVFVHEGWTLSSGGGGMRHANLQGREGGRHRTMELELLSPQQVRYRYKVPVPLTWEGTQRGYRTWTGGR